MDTYKTDLLDLRNMDCMDLMAQYPDKHFALAIVDPPYGVGSITYAPGKRHKCHGGFIDKFEVTMAVINMEQRSSVKIKRLTSVEHSQAGFSTILGFGDENVSPSPDYFKELFRVSSRQIILGGNYFLLPPSRGFAVWRKTTVSESFSMAMCEYAWISENTNAKYFEAAPQGTTLDPRIHPTQKPVSLYKWLLSNYANPGDNILDTHLGSASSAIACHYAGYHLTGSELDSNYFNASVERVKRDTAQQTLGLEMV